MKSPLVVSYGAGVDSTAALVGLRNRGIRPDLIQFANVGAERQATYDYLPVINHWLEFVGFPTVTVVTYTPKNFKHWPPYFTLEENLLTNATLPSIAYGTNKCSAKWKIAPQEEYCDTWPPAIECWQAGGKVIRLIGFEDSPRELKRAKRCSTFNVNDLAADRYEPWFALQEWGWDRERCKQEIAAAGLPVPPKSSCYFCTAMKPWEVDELTPDEHRRIVVIEARATQRHLDYAEAKGWPRGVGKPVIEGLWRKRVKGMRGATAKPGSMTEYIREQGLLPEREVAALIAATPTAPLRQKDFQQHGITNWQDWLNRLIHSCGADAAA